MLGVTADSVLYEEVAFGDVLDEYQLFVLHRVPFGEDVAWFLDQASRRGKRVLFDTDDLVFDLSATRFIAALEEMTDAQREHFLEAVVRCREALVRSDGVLVSTEPLADFARPLKDRVAVVPNVVSRAMLREATSARRWRDARIGERDRGRVTIAYLSGTATHNRDFLEAADAVLWALDAYPHVRFMTVGPVTLDDRFQTFSERVERVPLQPWRRLPDVLANVDISLAPLEPFNPFTNSKSCIKYLEAGLLNVPTIASPRWDFSRAIQHGVNGFLANTPDDWREALRLLIESDELRAQVGANARSDVELNHTTVSHASALFRTLSSLSTKPRTARPLTVNWVGSAASNEGPSDTPLTDLAAGLRARGHLIRMCAGSEELPAADLSVATDFRSAHRVHEHELSLFKLYLVQEFEPDRYATSQRQATEAEQAYELPLRIVCLDEAVAQRIARLVGHPVDCLQALPGALEQIMLEMCFARLDAA
jgi:glycosyltransferase involved in cell wall biosynthesis